jgi:hypothetical protein
MREEWRDIHLSCKRCHTHIAKKYNVTRQSVAAIIKGRIYNQKDYGRTSLTIR